MHRMKRSFLRLEFYPMMDASGKWEIKILSAMVERRVILIYIYFFPWPLDHHVVVQRKLQSDHGEPKSHTILAILKGREGYLSWHRTYYGASPPSVDQKCPGRIILWLSNEDLRKITAILEAYHESSANSSGTRQMRWHRQRASDFLLKVVEWFISFPFYLTKLNVTKEHCGGVKYNMTIVWLWLMLTCVSFFIAISWLE